MFNVFTNLLQELDCITLSGTDNIKRMAAIIQTLESLEAICEEENKKKEKCDG